MRTTLSLDLGQPAGELRGLALGGARGGLLRAAGCH